MLVGSGGLLALLPTGNAKLSSVFETLLSALEADGFLVHRVFTTQDFFAQIRQLDIDLGLVPASPDAKSLVSTIAANQAWPPVMVLAGAEQSALASQLVEAGAAECVEPEAHDLVRSLIKRTIDTHRETAALRQKLQHVKSDHQAAFDVQQKLLPAPQRFGEIAFGYHLVPRSGMSGDSVNCFELADGRLLFYLADVAGHGILGGVISTALTLTAKNLADPAAAVQSQSSSDLLVWFNRALLALKLERHVAMFLGVISADRRSLEYSSAAHFPGTILCQEDQCLYLELGGLPLGVCETEYEARRVDLSDTFQLVLFSDGVLEILPEASLEKRENHLISLVESGSRSVGAITRQLSLEGLIDVPDDIALLTLSRDENKQDPLVA